MSCACAATGTDGLQVGAPCGGARPREGERVLDRGSGLRALGGADDLELGIPAQPKHQPVEAFVVRELGQHRQLDQRLVEMAGGG